MNYTLTRKEIIEISEDLKNLKRSGNIPPGDFSFMVDSLELTKSRKTHLQSFYNALNKTEKWMGISKTNKST